VTPDHPDRHPARRRQRRRDRAGLPQTARRQRKKGIFWGVVGAIGLRVVLIFFALQLLAVPWLKIVGALLLFWIGVKLLLPEDDGHGDVAASTTLAGAIKTIIVADAVMSLDNVIAVAGAANGSMLLVVFGILVSIPIVVWGSQLVLKLMDRYPVVITAGGALLGWIGGGMIVTDPARSARDPRSWRVRSGGYRRMRRRCGSPRSPCCRR
jgi:YjbE family integral membrane protein